MRGGGGRSGGGAARGGERRTRSGTQRQLRRTAAPQRPPRKPPIPTAKKKKKSPPSAAAAERKRAPPNGSDEDVEQQPVEVVIQVKNQKISPVQNKKQQPAKKTASAGKVGKRKENIKKETLKKVSTEEPEKLENIVQVNVYTKVIPSPPKTENTPKPKPTKTQIKKDKSEKTKAEKEAKKSKDIKIEKDIKIGKDIKDDKPKKLLTKKEIKIKKEPKDDGGVEHKVKEGRDENIKTFKEDNETKEIIKSSKEEKKEAVKPKNRSKELAKKTVDCEQGKTKFIKAKIKEEKTSPITVQFDSEKVESSPPPSEKSPEPAVSPKTKKTKDDKEKLAKSPQRKKEPVSKKRAVKKTAKSAKKVEPLVVAKRHREASLNALAKVHCLYENESRNVMNEILDKSIIVKKKENAKVEKKADSEESEKEVEKPSRNLRSAPGMRGMGRYWDTTHIPSSSSSSSSAEDEESEKQEEPEAAEKEKPEKKARKRRKRCEVRMDLKDMVVTKRMASLNASAIMAATCQVEKRPGKGSKTDESSSSSMNQSSDDEVVVSGASKKVAVIVNQDTDLTITGLYTTRSTRHEGYCSIAGMQYRISSTSHTQTEATAVSSETLIHTTDHLSLSHSESGGSVDGGGGPGTSSPGGSLKSYTPLGALSSMQPPGQGGRPCGSSSAFSAPPYHHHPQEMHGYYQPAGPLIQHTVAGKSGVGSPPEPPPPPPYPPYPPYSSPYPPPHPHHPASVAASDYYYSRSGGAPPPGYRRPPWGPLPPPQSTPPGLMTEYLDPPPPPYPSYYHPYSGPPAPPPPPVCYASPVRVPFIDQGFQCPCPMQSACPKNVHTGPLTGASKRPEAEAGQPDASQPLVPVALALPPEPTVSPGPPSPARGSVGMPPSSSPALSTARKERWSPPADMKPAVLHHSHQPQVTASGHPEEAPLHHPAPPVLTVVQSPPPPALSPAIPPPTCTAVTSPAVAPPQPPRLAAATVKRSRVKRNSTELPSAQDLVRKRKKQSKTSVKAKGAKGEVVEEKEIENNNTLLVKAGEVVTSRLRAPLRLSNGWRWEGEPFPAKVYRTTEDAGVLRKCYPAMRHDEGDIIRPRDSILLRSGPKKNLPFVAKVSAMWENPDDGEMMVSVLWYYRPEHTEAGRQEDQLPDEIFASRHKDTNSVACIEDKCYVLTLHEYARYRKSLLASNSPRARPVVPPPADGYPRASFLPPGRVAPDLVFFCRQIYDFRQKKVLKKPPSAPPPPRT